MRTCPDVIDSHDNRRFPRRRTRLRPVKLASLSCRFIDEGTLFDLSTGGARVRRQTDRPLPPRFLLLDEIEMMLLPVAMVWEKDREVGLRLAGVEIRPSRAEIRRLTGPYYALPD
ncbi:hypothetical protein E3C22_13430 [Jiella endophytica]|uniref:PilZ domain-containing protein n=1 Tax=Jiella endophytica TaxID=2558362 RepID=A0A4Y8RG49_9HYPH|nr:PilZ domain-containing protein [Jiella endophytica]TFF21689.1 hypothetical protein E3C22_13430 [Jiella endophytica]